MKDFPRHAACSFGKKFGIAALVTAAAVVSFGLPGFCLQSAPPTFNNNITSGQATNYSVDINTLLGAYAFYQAGFTGTNSIVANIEGGYGWSGHLALADEIKLPVTGTGADMGSGQESAHPTEVGSTIAGLPLFPGDRREGIAYGATLWSGAVATEINGPDFDVSDASFFGVYATALLTGYNGKTADVTNSSFTYFDPPYSTDPNNSGTGTNVSGADSYTVALDGIAAQSGKTMVYAAGNSGLGTNRVGDPAAGYNSISAGALTYGTADAPYTTIGSFSSGGPNDYQGPVNPATPGGAITQAVYVPGVRAVVDIVAPGDNLSLAEYNGIDDQYTTGSAGTSFAAPMVAGAATLLCDVGNTKYQGYSTNGNVIKAVLLNSANTQVLTAYNNGQTIINGVLTTTQALDYSYGAGRLDMAQAYTQYTSGVTDVPGMGGGTSLLSTGWDYASVGMSGHNNYAFAGPLAAGSTFTATLNWFVDRTYAGLDSSGHLATTQYLDANNNLLGDSNDLAFVNLNLELFEVGADGSLIPVALSDAQYINTQHFYYTITDTADYVMQVYWAGENYDVDDDVTSQDYGVAWSDTMVGAEPGSMWLIMLAGAPVLVAWRRARRQPSPSNIHCLGKYC